MLKNNLLSKFVLLCAVLLAGAGTAWAETTYKLTQVTSVEAGKLYVFEQGKHVMNNNVSSSALQTTETYSTTGLEGTESYVWTLETATEGFYLKNVSLASNQYLNNASGTNVSFGSKSSIWTFTFTDGVALIQNKSNSSRFLGYTNSTSYAYKAYATSNLGSYDHAISVYELEVESGSTPEPGTVAAPTFSPAAGAVAYGTTVTLTQDDAAMIMYTTNGTDPDYEKNVGTLYENPIAITADMTIKAIAIDAEENVSAVASAEYTVQRPAAPTFSLVAGKVAAGTTVTISGTGAMIIYTTDGTTPTYEPVNGDEYENPIEITSSMTIKAIVVDEHEFVSSVAEATYVVSDPNILFYETFDNIDGTGGRDGSYSGSVGTNATTGTDETWTAITGGGASKCIKLGTGSKIQTAQTSAIALEGDATLTFSAAGWASETNTLLVQADNATLSGDVDITLTNGTWTDYTVNITAAKGDVVLYFKMKRGFLDDVKVEKAVAKSVATPTFSVASGTYNEMKTVELACETEGATIYYTTNGNVPTNESTEYTAAITVDETMTIKAIAYKNGEASDVASATYTIELPLTTIAEVKALSSDDTFYLDLTGAQIVYFDGKKNMYVRDASGAILFYNADDFSTSLTTGDVLSGVVSGKYSPYNGLPEVTNSDIAGLTATSNATVVAKTIAGTTDAIAANLCDLVKIENTDIVLNNSKYYVGESSDIQLYDGLHIGVSFAEGNADVQGIATVFNTTYELFPRYKSDIVYLGKAVAVEIGAAGMATFSCDKALDFTGVDAIAAYTATVTTEGKIAFTRIYKVPANTGLLLRNAQGEDKGAVAAINVPVLDGDAETVTGNALVAVDTEIAQLETETTGYVNYILNKVNGNLGFYKANKQKVAAGKAYLQVPANAARGSFAISFDNETTGIATVENASVLNENYYNLNGQRIVAPQKGLYIVNGKKVVLK